MEYKILVSSDPEEIVSADVVLLPGVGAFKQAMNALLNLHMDEAIKLALQKGALLKIARPKP